MHVCKLYVVSYQFEILSKKMTKEDDNYLAIWMKHVIKKFKL